ncbi:hypothetical protein [Agromyces lapidis]|uniref:Uncharacterized protein n=1 Tax=Agromyces lapidis TaxID=279574 RepID=A0ABV5STF2_9MICO|nr:hypothetical protein [Agromyces lapidis]
MEYSFAGLPLHVLLVHAVIVLTPLVALLLVVLAAWPAARRVLWLPTLIGAALLVPLGLLTVEAGKWLEARVPEAPLIQQHTGMGEELTPWLSGLLAVAVLTAAWALVERADSRRTSGGMSRGVRVGVAAGLVIASLAVAIGSTVTLVRIGEAGSRAVWEGSFSEDPLER